MRGKGSGRFRLLKPSTWRRDRDSPVVIDSLAEFHRVFGSTPAPIIEWWANTLGIVRAPGESPDQFIERLVDELRPKDYRRQVLADAWWELDERERIQIEADILGKWLPYVRLHEALDKVIGNAG